jgi:sortase A
VRVSRDEGTLSLLKVGVVLMALALVLVVAAVVVSVAVRPFGPEGVVAAQAAAAKGSDDPSGYSSSSSGEGYPSGEEKGLGSGSSSTYGGGGSGVVGQGEGVAKEEPPSAAAPESELANPQPQSAGGQTPPSEPSSSAQGSQPQSDAALLPGGAEEGANWPKPTPQEIQDANSPRHYGFPPGAIMVLTIPSIGIYDVPVYDSMSYWALANGIAHNPQTSLPWSNTPQRNVYLAGHRMGFRGTWSRMIFYNLDKLSKGDIVELRDREGHTYTYRVSEVFIAEPTDVWVMGQVRGRDLLTLQTCTPIPTFEKRLIVRADRI